MKNYRFIDNTENLMSLTDCDVLHGFIQNYNSLAEFRAFTARAYRFAKDAVYKHNSKKEAISLPDFEELLRFFEHLKKLAIHLEDITEKNALLFCTAEHTEQHNMNAWCVFFEEWGNPGKLGDDMAHFIREICEVTLSTENVNEVREILAFARMMQLSFAGGMNHEKYKPFEDLNAN